MHALEKHQEELDIINQLKQLKYGQRIVFHSGATPLTLNKYRAVHKLIAEGHITVVRKLLHRVPDCPIKGHTHYDHIAIGCKKDEDNN